ncbi:MAG TPA: TIGR03986 family CRISPR-associated RAMP protein [Rhodothermales bacterium]|nr:TIGR03986 family CRISPR-associated RAMP protein [Rhodothermales bacterium]
MTKHNNPTKADRTASAPYNFIPLPDTPILAGEEEHGNDALFPHHQYTKERLDGYFEVILETKSPTYVRGMLPIDKFKEDDSSKPFNEKKKNHPDFFTNPYTKAPIIPGSSIRGMLRQLIEIITYSQLKRFSERQLVYRAVGDTTNFGEQYRERFTGENKGDSSVEWDYDYPSTNVRGGFLDFKNGKPVIIPAQVDQYGQSFIHVEYHDADRVIGGRGRWRQHNVWVKPTPIDPSNRGKRDDKTLILNLAITNQIKTRPDTQVQPTGLVAAVLIESGDMKGGEHPKHWHCAIYEKDNTKEPIEISEDMWEIYKADRDMTRGIKTRKLGLDGQTALFYLLNDRGELVYFGSTKMFRLPYKKKISDCIPKFNPVDVDFADALFGFVRANETFRGKTLPQQGNPERAYASRIAITDAVLEPDQRNVLHPVITPHILASPKPTSFQLYLNQPNPDDKSKLCHYDSDEATIRGFKMYWHQGNPPLQSLKGAPKPNDHKKTQYTQMRPVKSGVKFRFKVHFTQLTPIELGALAWALQPKTPDDQNMYCHKIGMGKPLGMGSVYLQPELYIQDQKKRYTTLFNNMDWSIGLEKGNVNTYIQAFEEEMLFQLYSENEVSHLYEIRRVAQLLAMMNFTDHPRKNDIETQTLDVFRQRRVLPDQGKLAKLSGEHIPEIEPE